MPFRGLIQNMNTLRIIPSLIGNLQGKNRIAFLGEYFIYILKIRQSDRLPPGKILRLTSEGFSR